VVIWHTSYETLYIVNIWFIMNVVKCTCKTYQNTYRYVTLVLVGLFNECHNELICSLNLHIFIHKTEHIFVRDKLTYLQRPTSVYIDRHLSL